MAVLDDVLARVRGVLRRGIDVGKKVPGEVGNLVTLGLVPGFLAPFVGLAVIWWGLEYLGYL